MSGWKALLAAATIGLALATPAGADSGILDGVDLESSDIVGKCTYNGRTDSGNALQFVFGGAAVVAVTNTTPPDVLAVTCDLISPAQDIPGEEPTLRASLTCQPGPGACVTSPGLAGPWPMRPVLICISGYTITGSAVTPLPGACNTAPL